MSKPSNSSLTEQVLQSLTEIAAEAPSARISKISRDDQTLVMQIADRDERGANIRIAVQEGVPVIDIDVGSDTHFEIQTPSRGWRYEFDSPIEALRAIVLGVINHGFQEVLWRDEGRVVKSTGRVLGNDRRLESTRTLAFSAPQGAPIEEMTFRPYGKREQ